MLTSRGWWVLVSTAIITLAGVVFLAGWTPSVALLGISLMAWFTVEWALFVYRQRKIHGKLIVSRDVMQGGRVVPVTWVELDTTVRVTIDNTSDVRIPFVVVDDRPPPGRKVDKLDCRRATRIESGGRAIVQYMFKPKSPGLLRFEGVSLRFSDPCGFFYHRTFLRNPIEYLVLPPLTDLEGKRRGAKIANMLSPPGIHRLRRPGSGDELLDIRDYIPGDPPKMIAWKVSARRDVLMTKELENAVPVKCMVFLDCSQGVRVPVGRRKPIEQLVEVGASAVQAAVGNRDLAGLTVFNEEKSTVILPKRTTTHVIRMLRQFADSAALIPEQPQDDVEALIKAALPVAQDYYPDLMNAQVNTRPFRLYWKPLLETKYGWLAYLLWLAPLLFYFKFFYELAFKFINSFGVVGLGLMLIAIPVFGWSINMFWMLWFGNGIRGFLPANRRKTRRRKQLGLLFSSLDGTGPTMVERAIHDDVYLRERINRFLVEHRVGLPVSLLDPKGGFRFNGQGKGDVLTDALIRAVSRAKDNEVYVILADLVHLRGPERDGVLKAIRMATARHHRTIVILPWPEGMPHEPSSTADLTKRKHPDDPVPLIPLVERAVTAAFQNSYQELKLELTRAGATVLRVNHDDAIKLILDRLDRARGIRSRR